MPNIKTILSVLLLLQLQHQIDCNYVKTTDFLKQFNMTTNQKIWYSEPDITHYNNQYITLLRLKCNSNKNKCQIKQKVYTFNDPTSPWVKRTCDFTLQNISTLEYVELQQFGDQRIIADLVYVMYDNKTYIEQRSIEIIHMPNCNVRHIDIKLHYYYDFMSHLIVRDDDQQFDVFYKDFKICESGQCRVTYDVDGELVEGPICVIGRLTDIKIHKLKSGTSVQQISNKEYFALTVDPNLWVGFILKYGSTEIKEIFRKPFYYEYYIYNCISTKYNRVTVCWKPSSTEYFSTVNCSYVDLHGDHQENELLLSFPYNISTFEVHNLENGEFLVLTSPKQDNDETGVETINYHLWRFKSDGSKIGEPTSIRSLSCINSLKERSSSSIVVLDTSEIWITFGCQTQKYDANISKYVFTFNYNVKCLLMEQDEYEIEHAVPVV